MKIKKKLSSLLVPKLLRRLKYNIETRRKLIRHLLKDYGWSQALSSDKCIDKDGNPIPWFTYPAIDFLSQLDLSNKDVFEYGSGFSTLYWGNRTKSVISVETDLRWIEKITPQLPANCEILLSKVQLEDYTSRITSYGKFDIVVIDGYVHTRTSCSELSLQHLKPGGIIILDNSDRCLKSAEILRNAGLIQADFTGFTPLHPDAQTTTVFFSRDYNFQPLKGYQPHQSVAQPRRPYPNG